MIFDRIERELPDIKDNYHKERYIRIALAYKQFVMHNDIQSFLCVLTKHPSKMGILTTVLENFNDMFSSIAHPYFTNKESRDSTHKVTALVDLSVNNKQVIAPIAVDFEGIYNKKIIDVNLVATYFNKNNIHDLIKEAIALENNNQVGFYYLDKKRTQSIIKHEGYQLPSILNNSSSNIIIRKIDSNVNKKIKKITQSQQFVRWFGDWQNKPKSASKVVDGNGEPLVVYHQTGNDFTVFDTKRTGAGEFDSEMPTGVFMKSKRILAAYDESIKNADDEAIKNAYKNIFDKESVKLKKSEAELNNFCDKTGLLKRNDRVQKYGFGRSTAQKAVGSANKLYKTWSNEHNINNIKSLAEYYNVKYNDSERYTLLKNYVSTNDKGMLSP